MYEDRARQCTNTRHKERSCATLAVIPHQTIPATPWYSRNVGMTPMASLQHLEKLEIIYLLDKLFKQLATYLNFLHCFQSWLCKSNNIKQRVLLLRSPQKIAHITKSKCVDKSAKIPVRALRHISRNRSWCKVSMFWH